jgi:malonyl-CoA decarboxylase
VIGLKKKQEFAMKLCGDYKKFTYPQKLQLVLALAVDLGLQDLSLMVKTLPSIPRTQLVLYVMAAALGFSVRNDPSISKNIKRGLVSVPEQFFLLVGAVPPGPKFLIRLRGDLKFLIKKYESTLSKDKVEALEYLDMVMRDLFATQASMRFRRIDMSSEKTVAYILRNERVHAVKNWEDLNRRIVGPNRHCFGLFHANMPNSPLVFVETILTNRLCSKVDEVLDTDLPPLVTPSHIIFYSISNTTSGLRGLNIASHLLFLSIEHLKGHFPSCNIFATLSPVPGFAAWFKSVLNHNHLSYFTPSQLQHLNLQFGVSHLQLGKWLLKRLESQRWYQDKILLEAIKDVLIAACCRYVLFERKGDKMSDPVANFHLQNGAQVEQVRFLADTSPSSMEKSCGLMINYRYSIPSIDQTSVSYKLTASAAVSYVSVRYVWHGSSLILDGML